MLGDNKALNDLLSSSDREMSEWKQKLQEAETERAQYEIRCGRLEQQLEQREESLRRHAEVWCVLYGRGFLGNRLFIL